MGKKDLNRYFFKDNIQMVNKQIKRPNKTSYLQLAYSLGRQTTKTFAVLKISGQLRSEDYSQGLVCSHQIRSGH